MKDLITKKIDLQTIGEIDKLNPIGLNEWQVEFFSNFKPNSFLFACFDEDNEIAVGSEGYVSYPLFYNGEMIMSHRSERTMVNPNYRGKGIFEGLIKECDNEAIKSDSYMCWGATAALKPFVRAGFDEFTAFKSYSFYPIKNSSFNKIGLITSNLGLVNPLKLWKTYKTRNLENVKMTLALFSNFIKIKKQQKSISITPKELNLDLIQNLLNGRLKNQFCLVPDLNLFEWLKIKNREYKKVGYYLGENFIGYCIYRIDVASKLIHIVDIFTINAEYIPEILDSISKTESNKNLLAIFLPLNAENEVHKGYISIINDSRILNIQKAGSFVIKTIREMPKIKINDLLLTDLWLEL
jgi:hypothetical protein